MGLADLVQADTAMPSFDIRRFVQKMGSTKILYAVRLGATLAALDYRIVGYSSDLVMQTQ